jgi:hypothetical protein
MCWGRVAFTGSDFIPRRFVSTALPHQGESHVAAQLVRAGGGAIGGFASLRMHTVDVRTTEPRRSPYPGFAAREGAGTTSVPWNRSNHGSISRSTTALLVRCSSGRVLNPQDNCHRLRPRRCRRCLRLPMDCSWHRSPRDSPRPQAAWFPPQWASRNKAPLAKASSAAGYSAAAPSRRRRAGAQRQAHHPPDPRQAPHTQAAAKDRVVKRTTSRVNLRDGQNIAKRGRTGTTDMSSPMWKPLSMNLHRQVIQWPEMHWR